MVRRLPCTARQVITDKWRYSARYEKMQNHVRRNINTGKEKFKYIHTNTEILIQVKRLARTVITDKWRYSARYEKM